MADVTMCTNQLCPEAKSCYRVQAKPNIHRQSMAFFAYEIGVNGVECVNKIPMYSFEEAAICEADYQVIKGE